MSPVARAAILAGCTLALGAGCSAARPHARAIILISFDTLRPDHLGSYGYPLPTSPNLDAFRRDAVLFREAVAEAPSTLPSHASILTSLIPQHHGASIVHRTVLTPEQITLAEVLRDRGFVTAAFHDGGQLDPLWGLDQGFETYACPGPQGRFEAQVDAGTAWLATHRRVPFFLFLHTYEVHRPYNPPAEFRHALGITVPGTEADDPSIGRLVSDINDGRRPIEPGDRARLVGLYDSEIRSADAAFGRLVNWLEVNDLYDQALIVVTSDHGEEFGEHGCIATHGHTLHDELLRVVLVAKLPGSRYAGRRVDVQVRGIDVAPTILAAAGIAAPKAFEGTSVLGSLDGGPPPPQVSVAAHDQGGLSAIRTPAWKLDGHALYDLANDPGETTNVAFVNPAKARELREAKQRILGSRPPPRPVAASPDEGVLERLRALGYVGSGPEPPKPQPGEKRH